MKNIIRVEKLTKNKIEQLEDVINNYIALLEDETIVDIKLYNNQHEILVYSKNKGEELNATYHM